MEKYLPGFLRKTLVKVLGNPLLKKAIYDSNYYFIADAGTRLISLFVIPLLTRILSLNEFAIYDQFLLCAAFLATIVGLGIDSGVAIIIAENQNNEKTLSYLFTYSTSIIIMMILAFWGCGLLIIHFITIPFLSVSLINYLFLYLLFSYFNITVFNFLRWLGKSKQASLINLFGGALGALLGISFLLLNKHKTLSDYLNGLVLGNFLGSLACFYIGGKYFSFKRHRGISSVSIPELLKLSLPYVPTYLSTYLLNYTDRFVIFSLMSEKEYALYALIARLSQIPNFLTGILTKGFLPVLYLNIDNMHGKWFAKKVFQKYIICLVPILIIIFFLAKPLVSILGGSKYLAASSILPLLICTSFVVGGKGLNGFGFTKKRKTLYITYLSFGAIVLNLSLTYFLGVHYQLRGVAIGTLITAIIGSYFYTFLSEKLYTIGYNLKIISASYILCIIASIIFIIS